MGLIIMLLFCILGLLLGMAYLVNFYQSKLNMLDKQKRHEEQGYILEIRCDPQWYHERMELKRAIPRSYVSYWQNIDPHEKIAYLSLDHAVEMLPPPEIEPWWDCRVRVLSSTNVIHETSAQPYDPHFAIHNLIPIQIENTPSPNMQNNTHNPDRRTN